MAYRETQRSYWDSVAPKYDDLYLSAWSKREDSELSKRLEELLRGKIQPRVLDIGCGTGLVYRLLEQTVGPVEYMGIDISEVMLSKFQEWLDRPSRPRKVSLRHLSAKDASRVLLGTTYDLIVAANTAASFFGAPSPLFRDLLPLIKEDGTLFVSFLNRTSLRRILSAKWGPREAFATRGSDGRKGLAPALTLTKEQLERRCRRFGLTVTTVTFQSVFGGVLERPYMFPFEDFARKVTPSLGHSISVVARHLA